MSRIKAMWLQFAIVCFSVSCILLSCGKPTGKTEEPEARLKVGYLPISAGLAFFVGMEERLFDNVEIEPVKFSSGLNMAEALLSGEIDATSPGPADVFLASEVSSPGKFKIYLHSAYTDQNFIYSLVVPTQSSIKSAEDLRGIDIAVFPGVTNEALLRVALHKRFGWPKEELKVRGVAPQLQIDGLAAGEYKALVPLEPIGSIASLRNGFRLVEGGFIEKSTVNPLYISAHCLRSDSIREKPAAVRSFVQGMLQAVSRIRSGEGEARVHLQKWASLTEEQAAVTRLGEYKSSSETDISKVQELADLLSAEGALPGKVNVQNLYYKP